MGRFTSFARFFLVDPAPEHPKFLAALRLRAFTPLDRSQPVDRASGFVNADDDQKARLGATDVFVGDIAHFAWRVDEIVIPAWAVRSELEKWAEAFRKEHDRPPGRREKQNAKLEIKHTLRQRAPIRTRTFLVVWRIEAGQVEIWSGSRGIVDEIQTAVETVLGGRIVPVVPVTLAQRLGIGDRALTPTQALTVPGAGVPAAPVDSEEADRAEVEQGKEREYFLRGKAYLGREFLTWLLIQSESAPETLALRTSVVFTDKLGLRGITGEVVNETVRGAMSPYSPLVRRAIDRGLLAHEARLRVNHKGRVFEFTLSAETFDFKAVKLPELLSEEEDDALLETYTLAGELGDVVETLTTDFLRLRASPAWATTTVPAIREWAQEGR
jgi:hypothetical protein